MKYAAKTKVSSSTVALVVGIVVLAGASLVIANILPLQKYLVGSGSKPALGYCVYNAHTNGSMQGKNSSESDCVGMNVVPGVDNDGNGGADDWYLMFCPNITAPSTAKGGDGVCNCPIAQRAGSGFFANPLMEAQFGSRKHWSNVLNDGNKNTPPPGDIPFMFFGYAQQLSCECGVGGTDFCPDTSAKSPCGLNIISCGSMSGTREFMQRVAKMQNDWVSIDSTYQCTSKLPAGCTFTSSHRGSDVLDSGHRQGVAVDICCSYAPGDKSNTWDACNNTNVGKVMGIIPGEFSVIRECTGQEQTSCGNNTSGCASGLIHIDMKKRPNYNNNPVIQQNCVTTVRTGSTTTPDICPPTQ